jgi:hypothetical protein
MLALNHILSRRLWVIRDFNIWGTTGDIEFVLLTAEKEGAENRLMFQRAVINRSPQDVLFSDLTDWRGNNLPAEINSPWIIIAPRSEYSAFPVGEHSSTGFRVARHPDAPGPVTADLFIYELDRK